MEFGNRKVICEFKDEHIALLTIHSPENANALSEDVNNGILQAFNLLKENNRIKTVIITGTERFFIAGADLKNLPIGNFESARKYIKSQLEVFREIERFPKPVIAAVNGLTLGGGLELTLFCDLVISSSKAKFGFPEGGLGIIPPYAISRLMSIVGRRKAKELLLLGHYFSAAEAEEMGLINENVDPENLIPKALEWGNTLAEKAPFSLELIKQGIDQDLGGERDQYLIDSTTFLFGTEDLKEGILAFKEKRKANFVGR
ncbi:enoyl-CoA hydratase/isomerase family protein [Bacillus sp. JJ1533]|uniref:enoyl-CoA hydratase/isomerase family protein n=1 Tax=Bacillus sp. JJ1533 TaxID=3122959 RepID=UPI00300067FF